MSEPSFDASSEPPLERVSSACSSEKGNPFLGIHFRCCRTYGRIYRAADGSQYVGRCPRCQTLVRVPIRAGGSASRFFHAG